MLTEADVCKMFEIKCSKYKPEELTENLKDILFKEALNESIIMNRTNASLYG